MKYALHSDLFTITPSGHLVLQNPLNFEVSRAHTLIIANETLHRPPMVDYCTISILVTIFEVVGNCLNFNEFLAHLNFNKASAG